MGGRRRSQIWLGFSIIRKHESQTGIVLTVAAHGELLQILEQSAKLGVSSLERPAGYSMIRFGVDLNDVVLH